MEQCRRVKQLDGGCDLNAAGSRVAAERGGEQQQRRAQTLAARGQDMVAERRDQVGLRGELVPESAFDESERAAQALEHSRDRRTRISGPEGPGGLRHRTPIVAVTARRVKATRATKC